MPRLQNRVPVSGRIILLVDDDLDYLAATQRLLEREGHQVLAASSGRQALQRLRDTQVDLLLLDYFMPGLNGEAVVTELRQFNQLVQVILQTGYASEQPPRELMRRFDIQGYFDKSDGPEKLLLWTDVGLKAAHTVQLLERSRQGLRYVLDVTPALHKIQPQDDLLQGLLAQMCGLIGSAATPAAMSAPASADQTARPAVAPDLGAATGCVAMLDEGGVLAIRAGSGPYVPGQPLNNCLPPAQQRLVTITLEQAAIRSEEGFTVVPLQLRQSMLGVICVDRPVGSAAEMELLGESLRGDRLHAAGVEFVEAAEIDRQPVGGELGDLIGRLPPLVRPIHKVQCYHHAPWHRRARDRPWRRRRAPFTRTFPHRNRPRSSPFAP